MTTITKQHKSAIKKICAAMRLKDVTTTAMRIHGSIRLFDPIADVQYSLHESGYIRRYIKRGCYGYYGYGGRPKTSTHPYQLNKTEKISGSTHRILATADEQIVILINAVANYRGYISI
jgi:hypothetical protein